ncbi:MAG: type I-A CRISPR-associated protein Cas5a [Nitrososphaeria archaeon]
MKALWFRAEFAWGFSARIAGYNKTSPSFLFPPPTTVLGALLSSAARRLKRSERDYASFYGEVSSKVYAVSLKPLNFTPNPVADIIRSIKLDEKSDLKLKFDVPAKGRVFYVPQGNEPPAMDFVIVHDSDLLSLHDALKINRIGSKESLVSIVEVYETESVEKSQGSAETEYSFPVDDGITVNDDDKCYKEYYAPFWLDGKSIDEVLLSYYLGSGGSFVKYCIPKPNQTVHLSLSGRFAAYRFEVNGKEAVVVGIKS